MWNPSSPTRDQSCLGNRKSYPLDHERSPKFKTLIWKVSREAIIFLAWTIFLTLNSILKLGRVVGPLLNLSMFPKTFRLEDKLLGWPQKTHQDMPLFCPQPQQTPLYLCSSLAHSYHFFATPSLHCCQLCDFLQCSNMAPAFAFFFFFFNIYLFGCAGSYLWDL